MKKRAIFWIVTVGLIAAGIPVYLIFNPRHFCGEFDTALNKRVQKANVQFAGLLTVEPVPCEYSYMNIKLKQERYTPELLDSLHSALYNVKTNEGWAIIMVYDMDGRYLISHGPNNKMYRQTGD